MEILIFKITDGGRMNLVRADGIFNHDSKPAIGIEIGRLESE